MVGFEKENNMEIAYEKELLKHNILTVGPLHLPVNLPDTFLFCALPLKIKESDGSPVRAIVF